MYKSKGVIGLLSLLVIVLIAAATVSKIALNHHKDIKKASIFKAKIRALQLAISTEQYYERLFADEYKKGDGINSPEYDSYIENWALALPFLPVEDGRLSAKITDLQSKLNVNNLAQYKTWQQQDRVYSNATLRANYGNLFTAMYAGTLKEQGLEQQPMPIVIDWMDINTRPIVNGAEDLFYLGESPSYRVANQIFSDISELNLLKGFNHHIVSRLSQWIVVLPNTNTKININTAPPRILAWLLLQYSNLSLLDQEVEVKRLQSLMPYKNINDFINEIKQGYYYEAEPNALEQQKNADIENLLSVTSQHYLLESRIEVLDYNIVIYSYLQRNRTLLNVYRREMSFVPQYIPLADEETQEDGNSSIFDIDN